MKHEAPRISAIAVRGFKSICHEQRIELKPLTILAGANSSGKSERVNGATVTNWPVMTRRGGREAGITLVSHS